MSNGCFFKVTRCQVGWSCVVVFTANTAHQFTSEQFQYETGGRWWWTAIIKGWWGMRRLKKRIEREHAEARRAKGWL